MRSTLILGFFLCGACTHSLPPKTIDQSVIDRLPVMMEAYGVDGMSVAAVSGQNILLSVGYGQTKDGVDFSADTACPIYSATKVLTSLTIASLVEDEAFNIDSTLKEHLADVPDEWKDIPFWRLLNHTTGIAMIVNKPIFPGIMDDPDSSNTDVYQYVRQLPLDYSPGEHSRYRQSGYGIAEMVLTKKYKKDWPTLVADHVTGPAEAARTLYSDQHNGKRNLPLLSSAGGFETTASDMAQIFKALNRGDIVTPVFLENWLYEDKHNFDDYSLGSVLKDVGDTRTIGHSGGGRANLRYAPDAHVGVMVCTDDTSNNNIIHGVADMLMQELVTGKRTLMPIQTRLHGLHGQAASEIIRAYEDARSASEQTYDFAGVQNALNQIGYGLLAEKKAQDAIAIFRLNTREFPTSPNTYDSLGEALLAAGNHEEALRSYQKVIDLDAGNENATRMIEIIRSETSGQFDE